MFGRSFVFFRLLQRSNGSGRRKLTALCSRVGEHRLRDGKYFHSSLEATKDSPAAFPVVALVVPRWNIGAARVQAAPMSVIKPHGHACVTLMRALPFGCW